MAVALDRQWASVRPSEPTTRKPTSLGIGWLSEKLDGQVVAERENPRRSFDGHEFATPWDAFAARLFQRLRRVDRICTTPFLFTMNGFTVHEIAPVHDKGETWWGLQAHFPAEIASHSTVQEFYSGPDFLLRRHDYRVEIAGGFPAIQYVSDIIEADGIKLPTRRLAYRADVTATPFPISRRWISRSATSRFTENDHRRYPCDYQDSRGHRDTQHLGIGYAGVAHLVDVHTNPKRQGRFHEHHPLPCHDHIDAAGVRRRTHRLRPGRSEIFSNSADSYLKVHQQSADQADVTEGSGGVWERLDYDWSDLHHVKLTTTDSNVFGGASDTST